MRDRSLRFNQKLRIQHPPLRFIFQKQMADPRLTLNLMQRATASNSSQQQAPDSLEGRLRPQFTYNQADRSGLSPKTCLELPILTLAVLGSNCC
jgi:hypothetical protein